MEEPKPPVASPRLGLQRRGPAPFVEKAHAHDPAQAEAHHFLVQVAEAPQVLAVEALGGDLAQLGAVGGQGQVGEFDDEVVAGGVFQDALGLLGGLGAPPRWSMGTRRRISW